jgi:hypothetical protein
MTTIDTRLEIKSWDEKPYRELSDGTKFARAEVALEGAELTGAFESLLYYRADGSGSFVSLMSLSGTLGGRDGSLVLVGEGSYDGTTAMMSARAVEATGELAGLTGTATSRSTHADYPFMPLTLTYELG